MNRHETEGSRYWQGMASPTSEIVDAEAVHVNDTHDGYIETMLKTATSCRFFCPKTRSFFILSVI